LRVLSINLQTSIHTAAELLDLVMHLARHPNLNIIFHNPLQETVSTSFVRSTKVVYSPTFSS